MPGGEKGSPPTRWCCLSMFDDLAHACGGPAGSAILRSVPEDFIVDEVPSCVPDGEGEHAWLVIRKRDSNTEWVARELARFAGVETEAVGYAGLKDRHALTTQVFTVALGKQAEPDWQAFASEVLEILAVDRHRRPLRRGALRENRFVLTLREMRGDAAEVEMRLSAIRTQGVPNYFGPQRFGHDGNNLQQAREMFAGRFRESNAHRRGLYLSAARSWLFNLVLSERVRQQNWLQALPGEALIMPGSDSSLSLPRIDAAIQARIDRGDLQPSGPMWGRGQALPRGEALALEEGILSQESELCQGLEKAGLKQQRRALRLAVPELKWEWLDAATLRLSFALPPGCYATSVLREIARCEDVALSTATGAKSSLVL